MDIIKAYAVNNLCYIAAQKMKPQGIVVHSTGANNPTLKRYVNCPEEVGENKNHNHWDNPMPEGKRMCVHAFIGYDKNNEIRVAEILPLDICCWGCASGSKGSYNSNPPHIQFEICEDGLTDKVYYDKVFGVAAEYCAHLCRLFGLTSDQIVSHKEAHDKGYGSNHGDPDHWMKKFGETMDDFRAKVSKLLGEFTSEPEAKHDASSTIKDGDLVSIADNATYYNGKTIPSWVKSQNWHVKGSPVGNRVVIDQNEKLTNSICSPVDAKYLTVVKKSSK